MNRREMPCEICGTWNAVGTDICPTCGTALVSQSIAPEPPKPHYRETSLDRFFESWANTSNPFLRMLYMLGKGIWMVYMAIVAFILWIIAALPG